MPKGHHREAWEAYNEAMRKIENIYRTAINPLRTKLHTALTQAQVEYEEAMEPISTAHRKKTAELHADFEKNAEELNKQRLQAEKSAREVRDAELKAEREAVAA